MPGLHLIAQDAEEAPIISALMQDAVVRANDMSFDPRRRRFLMLANRFCWEARTPMRARSLLTIGCVGHVARRQWTHGQEVLDLLALRPAGEEALHLDFAGGPALRLTVECIDLMLDDVSASWPVRVTPRHG